MDIFENYQNSLPSKYSGWVQVSNVSNALVRLGDSGPYLMPGMFAVMPWNPRLDKAIELGTLLKYDFSVDGDVDNKPKKTKKTEPETEITVENTVDATEEPSDVAAETELS